MLFNKGYTPTTIDKVVPIFDQIAKNGSFEIRKHLSEAHLDIPISTNMQDATSIIEFLLNMAWEDIPQSIQTKILKYIENKNEKLTQCDGILEITRL